MTRLDFSCAHTFRSGFELDLRFQSDHFVTCLFGPSGSGKTSALSILAGLLRPQRAAIRFENDCLTDTVAGLHLAPELRGFGYVFQDHLLFPHLTVEGNLRFGHRPHRVSGPPVEFDRVVKVLELSELLTRRPRHLSGGQRQRVALGRALLSRPRMLLMDEPLAALDEQLKGRILEYLERIVTEWRLPTLFVSHSQAEVRRLAQWVVVVEAGRVVAEDTPEVALGQPRTLGYRDEVGPANLLRIDRVTQADGRWTGWIGNQALSLPFPEAGEHSANDQPVYVQFAPGDVMISRQDVRGLSARNHLRGLVRQLIDVPSGVFVAVDLGQIIWSAMTREAAAELELVPGVEVHCLIKTHSLRRID